MGITQSTQPSPAKGAADQVAACLADGAVRSGGDDADPGVGDGGDQDPGQQSEHQRAASIVTFALGSANPASPPARHGRVLSATGTRVAGSAGFTTRPWGTSIQLDLTGLAAGRVFTAHAVSTSGAKEIAAQWSSTPTGVARVVGATSLRDTQLARVEIIDDEGHLVATGRS